MFWCLFIFKLKGIVNRMKKRIKVIIAIILPIISILSICLPFAVYINRERKEEPPKKVETIVTSAEDTGASSAGRDQKGGAIFVDNNATYTMTGGSIIGTKKTYGGAVFIGNGATFTMNAGTITGCQAKYGGAIYVASGGTCNINGGTITGNKAENAPAIYVETGATLNISEDAVIENNEYGVCVVVSSDTIVVGNPSANFSLPYIDFGSYPQTYVGNNMNTTLENWYTSNTPTSVKTYVVRRSTWEAYEYTDGNIYVRGSSLKYSSSTGYLSGEDIKASGSAVWFKVEPIRWIILNYEEYTNGNAENLEIMSYLALTADIRFNASSTDPDGTAGTSDDPNQWVNSELRTWLNGTFYTSAFSTAEQGLIAKTTVRNNVTNNYNTSTSNTSGVATEDNIYCLSYWDLYNSNSASIFNSNPKKLCSPTDFALSNYCYKYTNTSCVTATYPNGGTCYYWMRSAGSSASYAWFVYYTGSLSNTYVYSNNIGVRPVLQLSI